MQTIQPTKSCPVFLHPAAAQSKASIEAIQRRTGLVIITTSKQRHPQLPQAEDTTPWRGDAA